MSQIGREISEATQMKFWQNMKHNDARKWNEIGMGPWSQLQIRTISSMLMDLGGPQNHNKPMESKGEFEMVQR